MRHQESDVSRRAVLRGAAVGGVVVPLLAACGSDDEAPTSDGNGGGAPGGRTTGLNGWVIGTTADVPVGGGALLGDGEIVVTQAIKGEFKAFSGVCPHMRCLVTSVDRGTIKCPCHGSAFSIADGSVVAGPAPAPLAELEIAIDGDSISIR